MSKNNEGIIEVLDRLESNPAAIYVREIIDGKWQNISLLELPTHLAIKHTCRFVRDALRKQDG